MLHLIKTKTFPSLTNPNNNTDDSTDVALQRSVLQLLFFFQKAKFMGKLVLNDKSCQKPKASKLPTQCSSLSYLDYPISRGRGLDKGPQWVMAVGDFETMTRVKLFQNILATK